MFFKYSSTGAAASADFRILVINNIPAPIILIRDPLIAECFTKYFRKNYNVFFFKYNYFDIIFLAVKKFKKFQRNFKADTLFKFTKFFDSVKKLCIKVQEIYLVDFNIYKIYDYNIVSLNLYRYRY